MKIFPAGIGYYYWNKLEQMWFPCQVAYDIVKVDHEDFRKAGYPIMHVKKFSDA